MNGINSRGKTSRHYPGKKKMKYLNKWPVKWAYCKDLPNRKVLLKCNTGGGKWNTNAIRKEKSQGSRRT